MAETLKVFVQLVQDGTKKYSPVGIRLSVTEDVDDLRKAVLKEFPHHLNGIDAASLHISSSADAHAASLKLGLLMRDEHFPRSSDEEPLFVHVSIPAHNAYMVRRS